MLTFQLVHTPALTAAKANDPGCTAAEQLIETGLCNALTRPAPSKLELRVASRQAFHRMKNLSSPFDVPVIRQARAKARRAAKSDNPFLRGTKTTVNGRTPKRVLKGTSLPLVP